MLRVPFGLYVLAAIWCGTPLAFSQSKAATTTTLAVTSGGGSVTSVASGRTVTLTATVKAGSNGIFPGQVNFCDATAPHCSDVHLLGTAQLIRNGTADIKFLPGPGTHSYKAEFVSTGTYAASASSSSTLVVTTTPAPVASATTIAKTGNWDNYTLTGTVTEVGSTAPVSGSVSFVDSSEGNAVLGTGALGPSTGGFTWVNSQTAAAGFGPEYVTVGDFNGDGVPDLAVTDARGNSVTIFLGNGDGTFSASATSYQTPSPQQIVAGDFNGDGVLDLAVANSASAGTLTIFLGNGDGTFTAMSATPSAGLVPVSLTVGDFNGDGISDIAVASPFYASITICLGKGDGTFTTSQVSPANMAGAYAIAAGDFNGDGKADLVFADAGSNQIRILTGNGDGTFATWLGTDIGSTSSSIAVADFNGDGRPDIVATSIQTSAVTVLLNHGDGTFATSTMGPPAATEPSWVGVGDFNGDGIPDIAYLSSEVDAVTILFGNGDGTFTDAGVHPGAGTGYLSMPYSIGVADFNADGRADLGVVVMFDGTLTVLLSEPTQTASTPGTAVAPSGMGQHMVEASYGGSNSYNPSASATTLLWGQPPATATTLSLTAGGSTATNVSAGTAVTLTATVMVGATPLTTGQVNFCDASVSTCAGIDLIGTSSLTSTGTASFKFVPGPGQHSYKAEFEENANGARSSSPALTLTVGAPAHVAVSTASTVALGGSTGNYTLTATVVGTGSNAPLTGKVSFFDTSHSNAPVAAAALGTSTPGLGWVIASSTPFTDVTFLMFAAGDFNGDGVLDIAVVNQNGKTVTLLLGKGDGTFNTLAGPTLSGYTSAVVAGDFNGDGQLDLAVSSWSNGFGETGSLTIFLGNGDGTFTAAAAALAVGNSAKVFAAADFNGDGKLDLLVNDSTGTCIFLGNGDGTFTQAPATGLSATVAVGDLNDDGFPDLVVGWNTSAASVYLSQGDGTFRPAPGTALPADTQLNCAVIGDFNGDGKPDIALASLYYSSLRVFLGNGDGTFTPASGGSNVSLGETAGMVAADLNHDGNVDLVLTQASGNYGMIILLGNGDGTFTSLPGDTQVAGAWSILAGDINGDGVPDLLVGAAGMNALLTEPTQTATATASGVNPAGPTPHLVDASYLGDSNYNASTSSTVSLDVQVAAPVFNPPAGTYTSSQTVTITESTPGATIYYTNSAIYPSTWTVYSGPITLNTEGSYSFQAYATATGYEQSTTVNAAYTMNLPAAAAPVITPGTGSYGGPQTVTISDSSTGAIIYYTTDGTNPTTQSARYTGPITVSTSEAIVAIASGGGYNTSPAVVAQILINSAASSFIYTVAGNESSGYTGDGGPATVAGLNEPRATVLDRGGNLYIADAGNCVVRKVDANSGNINTFAGTGICGYDGDHGAATSAQLSWPSGLAMDLSGNLYISDNGNGVVRKVDTQGTITTWAGSNSATSPGDGGPATSAQIIYPEGLVFDSSGNLYIASQGRVRMVNGTSGVITTVAGNGNLGYGGDNGSATSATVYQPTGIVLDFGGNLYFSDVWGVVRKVTAKTGIISTVAGTGVSGNHISAGDGGPATSATLSSPYGLAIDLSGNLFIADTGNNEVREVTANDGIIHKIVGSGSPVCVTESGDGGPSGSSGVCSPYGINVDSAGNFYIAESGLSRIRKVTVAALPPTQAAAAPVFDVKPGTYSTPQTVNITSTTPEAAIYITLDGRTPSTIGSQFQGALNVNGSIKLQAVAVAPGYLASNPVTASYTITAAPSAVIQTIAGNSGTGTLSTGGPATSENFGWLTGVAVDGNGNVYIPDENHAVVWMVSASTGDATIVAGTLNAPGETGDNALATASQLNGPSHVAVDKNGNLYIADTYGNRIRKVTSAGIVTTYAGGGLSYGPLGDGGPATSAVLNSPQGLAVDGSGNLYIADQNNHRIREVATNGIITTVAGGGTAGVLGDGGPATSAWIQSPPDVAVDGAGNLYIADEYSARVRKVTASSGILSTIAGNGNWGASGDGLPATAAEVNPLAVTVDSRGNVYFANWPDTVRMVDATTHAVTTVAGSGYNGISGDGGSATLAELCEATSVAADNSGHLYIADACNYRIRKVTFAGAPTAQAAMPRFSPDPGFYSAAQAVTIMDDTPGAAIYYTTDGTTPTTASVPYTGAITVASSQTIKAIAAASGYSTSEVANGAYTINILDNPAPQLTSLSPAFATAGTASFTITVKGSGFTSTSTLYWETTALTTQHVDGSTLAAQVPASSIAAAGITSITVQTPTPGGGTSNILKFEIDTAGSVTPPSFTNTTATVTAGSTATYPVTLPSSATNVSAACLNLPTGASCAYSASGGALSIATSSSTPKGSWQVTVVFSETLRGAASAWIFLPFLLWPLAAFRRSTRLGRTCLVIIAGLVIVASAGVGCGGGGTSGGGGTPPPVTHNVTSSGTVILKVQ